MPHPNRRHPRPTVVTAPRRGRLRGGPIALLLTLVLAAAACSSDDGATVRDLGATEAESGGSASASASAPSGGAIEAGAVEEEGGYRYVSDVSAHRLVTADVCEIKEALDAEPVDWGAVEAVYDEGGNSVNSDGSVRTLAGFAAAEDGPEGLDGSIRQAIDGSGPLADASESVRAQIVEKGIQNHLLVAWTVDELDGALAKAEAGDLDPAGGAPHNWDEAWAFYHGAAPGCAPWATANSRAANFGTVGADGETARANEAIVDAMNTGRDALVDGDVDGARAAADEVVRNLVVTYSQAAIRYATFVPDDVAADDLDGAAEHRAEGLAFFRAIEHLVAEAGADVEAIEAVFDLEAELGSTGGGDEVSAALAPAWEALGIDADDIGELSS